MKRRVFTDVETYSEVDLRKEGLARYAQDLAGYFLLMGSKLSLIHI